jgi:hypothetical protein
MRHDVMYAQLLAARAALDAAMLMIEQAVADGLAGPCSHPMEKRRSLATMGKDSAWICQACDHIEEG